MPEERIDDYLAALATAADWTPEGAGIDDRFAGTCPACGHALEIDADGWYICDNCELAWPEAPTPWPAHPFEE